MSLKISIKTIPHKKQRYPTCGDWTVGQMGEIKILVSELGNWRREALIAIHELVEVLTCMHDGVSQKEVDVFDMKFEKDRKPGDDSEPGDNPAAPYVNQHCLATGIERILAAAFNIGAPAQLLNEVRSPESVGDQLDQLP